MNENIEKDIVVSSRIRLARNIKGIPFINKMSLEQLQEIIDNTIDICNKDNRYKVFFMKDMIKNQKQKLVEQHIASKELIKKKQGVLLLNKNDGLSVFIGEEDHLRIQCILPGLQIEKADRLSQEVDSNLSALNYAFNDKLGYLTTCPTNLGTGMRASVMMHLPMLAAVGQIQSLLDMVGKFGFTLRGFFGENTKAQGDMYQLSNQVTLGVSENDIITNLREIVKAITEKERSTREAVMASGSELLEDKIFRSFGALKYAKKVSNEEMMQKISDIKLGICLNLINGIDCDTLERIIANSQPASIELRIGESQSKSSQDIERATILRSALTNCETTI